MTNREQLTRRALRAYELGRLRTAASVALYILPVLVASVCASAERERCACLGVLGIALAIAFRWRNRRGSEAVTLGLVAGAVPLCTGLILARSVNVDASTGVAAACLVAGAIAGVWLGIRAARRGIGLDGWAMGTAVGLVAASVGCVELGITAAGAAFAGLLIAGTAGTLFATRR